MYFWAALIGFGALAYSVNNASMWIVLGIVVLSFIGLVLLLLPRFQPRAPRWAERFVPPRYRRRRPRAAGQDTALAAPAAGEAEAAQAGEAAGTGESSAPLATTAAAVNGASALGARPRLLDGRKTETSR
jgi:UDP-GlcNAc:undecaprenyl-phosphate GlcNAc-1-phosphate transferase